MIPASYLFKSAYRGAWGTSQVETGDEATRRQAIRAAADASVRTRFAAATRAHTRSFAARMARSLAVALYRWSRGGAYAGLAGRVH